MDCLGLDLCDNSERGEGVIQESTCGEDPSKLGACSLPPQIEEEDGCQSVVSDTAPLLSPKHPRVKLPVFRPIAERVKESNERDKQKEQERKSQWDFERREKERKKMFGKN